MGRRAWVAGGVAVLLVLAGTAGWRLSRDHRHACGAAVTSISAKRSSSPFLDAAARKEQPDARRDRAVASLGSAPAPFGPVVGAVGYDYEQWAQISAYDQGIGIRTRDNPDFTMLDDQTLTPRWSVQVDTKRSTYDAGGSTYLVATMPAHGSPDLVALDASTGARRWCASLDGVHVGADDPFATEVLDDGGVVVLGPGSGGRLHVVRIDPHGRRVWTREVTAEKGDFLGLAGEGLLVLGGRPLYELADARAFLGRSSRLLALDLDTGRTVWRTSAGQNVGTHVIGVDDGLSVVVQRNSNDETEDLAAFDEQGDRAWTVRPDVAAPLDVALRGGRLLVRGRDRWEAYAAATGKLLWRRTMPSKPQLLPYGFQLEDVPLLDADHAVVGTTTGLQVLDLRTGAFTGEAPLPTDGINTTYWPYAVAVSPHLVAVATNTSAVLLRRR